MQERGTRSHPSLTLALAIVPLGTLALQAASRHQTEIGPAEVLTTAPIEREISPGESHTYAVPLEAGHYLEVAVEQRDIDVLLVLLGPRHQKLGEFDKRWHGPERGALIADSSGVYYVEIQATNKQVVPGRYRAQIHSLGPVTAQDRTLVSAELVFAQGERSKTEGTVESLTDAISKFEKALSLWRSVNDGYGEIQALANLGFVYRYLGNNRKALQYFTEALSLSQDVADHAQAADLLNYAGNANESLGQKEKALPLYEQALLLWQAEKNSLGEAETYNNIGSVHLSFGRLDDARQYFEKALPLFQAKGDRFREGIVLVNLGGVHDMKGEKREALALFTRALPLIQAAGDKQTEAVVLYNTGGIYDDLDEEEKSLEYLRRALDLTRSSGDRRIQAWVVNKMGQVYDDVGETERALSLFKEALSIHEEVRDQLGQTDALRNIGWAHYELDKKDQALRYYNEALRRQRDLGDKPGQAVTLRNVALVHHSRGARQKAVEYLNKALSLSKKMQDRRGEAVALAGLGLVHSTLAQKDVAMDYFGRARELSVAVGDRRVECESLFRMARLERDSGNDGASLRLVDRAIDIVESLRRDAIREDLQSSFFATKQNYYDFKMGLLMELHRQYATEGYDVAAFDLSERARARALLQLLGEDRARIRRGVDPSLLDRLRSLQLRLNATQSRFEKVLAHAESAEEARALREEIETLLAEYHEVRALIRRNSPQYAALTDAVAVTFNQIQAEVLDEDSVLLEYKLAEERSYLWAVTQTSLRSYALPKQDEIETLIGRFHYLLRERERTKEGETLQQTRDRVARADAEAAEVLTRLGRMLLSPVASQLRRKRLLIVGDGALHYLPFAALPVPADTGTTEGLRPPLALEHEVIHLPSASTLVLLRKEEGRQKAGPKTVALFGDAVFRGEDPRVENSKNAVPLAELQPPDVNRGLERSAKQSGLAVFERLIHSGTEVEYISALVPPRLSFLATGFQASKETLRSLPLSSYRYLHFASHGLLNTLHPELSGLVLSLVDEKGQSIDGFLRLHEIYNLDLNARMVVLSACQTALGKDVKGEGLIGLTRGFMYAGAQSVVASLWRVDDKATAELMKRLYQGLLTQGLQPAAALREAQASMWKEDQWKAPYYWAGFVFQGDWRP